MILLKKFVCLDNNLAPSASSVDIMALVLNPAAEHGVLGPRLVGGFKGHHVGSFFFEMGIPGLCIK